MSRHEWKDLVICCGCSIILGIAIFGIMALQMSWHPVVQCVIAR